MQTSAYDFVSALSAEELCPVCEELHAAVDECLCSECQQHVCSDCSSLQPDTSWICRPCAALMPSRAYPVATRPSAQQVARVLLTVREQTANLRMQLAPNVQRLAQRTDALRVDSSAALRRTAKLWLAALFVFLGSLRARWSALHEASSVAGSQARARASTKLSDGLTWARPRLSQLSVQSRTLGSRALLQLRTQSVRGKQAVVSSVQYVRALPVRHHAVALLIATIILLAVSRSQTAAADPR